MEGISTWRGLACEVLCSTWKIIPASKWLVTPIYAPFRPFGRGTTRPLGDLLTMVIYHLLSGMIVQVILWTQYSGWFFWWLIFKRIPTKILPDPTEFRPISSKTPFIACFTELYTSQVLWQDLWTINSMLYSIVSPNSDGQNLANRLGW